MQKATHIPRAWSLPRPVTKMYQWQPEDHIMMLWILRCRSSPPAMTILDDSCEHLDSISLFVFFFPFVLLFSNVLKRGFFKYCIRCIGASGGYRTYSKILCSGLGPDIICFDTFLTVLRSCFTLTMNTPYRLKIFNYRMLLPLWSIFGKHGNYSSDIKSDPPLKPTLREDPAPFLISTSCG